MDYSTFKDFLITFLWRDNDTVLIANLDTLITMGNASLNRDLRVEDRHMSIEDNATAETYTLPTDYRGMRSVVVVGNGECELLYCSPAELQVKRNQMAVGSTYMPWYSLQDKTLMLATGATVADPLALRIDYMTKVPDFATTDTSWVAEEMLDTYVAAVLQHVAMFLREDDRVQMWSMMYVAGITAYNTESAHTKQIGVYKDMPLPRAASSGRRRY